MKIYGKKYWRDKSTAISKDYADRWTDLSMFIARQTELLKLIREWKDPCEPRAPRKP